MRNLKRNGEIESINGEKWSWESEGPPLVDKMDIVEALAPLNVVCFDCFSFPPPTFSSFYLRRKPHRRSTDAKIHHHY